MAMQQIVSFGLQFILFIVHCRRYIEQYFCLFAELHTTRLQAHTITTLTLSAQTVYWVQFNTITHTDDAWMMASCSLSNALHLCNLCATFATTGYLWATVNYAMCWVMQLCNVVKFWLRVCMLEYAFEYVQLNDFNEYKCVFILNLITLCMLGRVLLRRCNDVVFPVDSTRYH